MFVLVILTLSFTKILVVPSLWAVLICIFKLLEYPNFLLQYLQINFLSPVCVTWWSFKLFKYPNLLLQILHRNCFSPCFLFIWSTKFDFFDNLTPHISHAYSCVSGFFSLWHNFKCLFKWYSDLKFLLHIKHVTGFSVLWEKEWPVKSVFWPNDLLHIGHI